MGSSKIECIRRGKEYDGKNLFYIAGLNIDISEYDGFPPTTYFVPWAAHIQLRNNPGCDFRQPVEQEPLYNMLISDHQNNPAAFYSPKLAPYSSPSTLKTKTYNQACAQER